MFLIGVDLDLEKLKNKAQSAIVISHASIVFPYFLGVSLAYMLYQDFAPAGVSFLSFALFMGIAMSITAFPVLARILKERGLTQTPLGAMALTCAAADDVTAWCILAAVIAIVKAGNITGALLTISLSLIFVLVMVLGVRPLLKKEVQKMRGRKNPNERVMVTAFFILLACAWLAEIIGIHALFGAFLAGAIMPKNNTFKDLLAGKTEDISVLVLLPLFFAFTGLRTQIGLLNDGHLWAVCGLIIFVAVFGKFGGSAIAAKITGQSWTDSFSIGALMNTRGLMELIVLNIGYDLGILSASIFAILVLMALATTLMTNPLLDGIALLAKKRILPPPIASEHPGKMSKR
jgi:Kef-type K+ transport system membrane component KefB